MSEHKYSDMLYHAIKSQNVQAVKDLLAEGGNVNVPRTDNPILGLIGFENIYPLEAACKTSAEMAGLLLEAGADASVVDPYLQGTPLLYALSAQYEERFDVAFRLIEAGARIDQVDENKMTALNRAVILLPTDGQKARERQLELTAYLFAECDLEMVLTQSSSNPLVEAARFNNTAVMNYILERHLIGINRTAAGYTALMRAVLTNSKEACELLIKHGADMTPVSPKGKTAYDYALWKNNPEILRLFENNFTVQSPSDVL